MRDLAAGLASSAHEVVATITSARLILSAHGYHTEAARAGSVAVDLMGWSEAWRASLHKRAEILANASPTPISGQGGAVATALVRWALTAPPVADGSADERLALAADAMLEGSAPAEAGVGARFFPGWYVAVHRRRGRLLADIAATRAELAAAWSDLAGHGATGLEATIDPPLATAIVELSERLDDLETELDEVRDSLAVPLPVVIAHVVRSPLVSAATRETVVAEMLAAAIMDRLGDPDEMLEVSTLVAGYVTTPAAAVALYEALPSRVPPQLVALSGIGPHRPEMRLAFVAPFAVALATATHQSPHVASAAEFVEHADAGFWFVGAHEYSIAFLRAAAAAAVASANSNATWSFETVHNDGMQIALDPRVETLQQLAAAGPLAVAGLVDELRAIGDLGELLDPAVAYGDGGAAAGKALAALGTSHDERVISAIAAVVEVTGGVTPDATVLQGAASMVAPHLSALAPPADRETLPFSPLGARLDGFGASASLVGGFLAKVLDEPVAAETMFAAFTATLAAAVANSFDPGDPQSINEAFWEAGALADRLMSTYLRVELADASSNAVAAGLWQWIVSGALELLAGAAVAALTPAGFIGLVSDTVAGATFATLDARDGPSAVESVLLGGYGLDADLVDAGVITVLQLLHAAHVVELPPGWFEDGRLALPTASELEAFIAELEASGFPVWDWLLAPMAIAGATIGDGSPAG